MIMLYDWQPLNNCNVITWGNHAWKIKGFCICLCQGQIVIIKHFSDMHHFPLIWRRLNPCHVRINIVVLFSNKLREQFLCVGQITLKCNFYTLLSTWHKSKLRALVCACGFTGFGVNTCSHQYFCLSV